MLVESPESVLFAGTLELTLQPESVEWVQRTFLDTLGAKLVATTLLLTLIAGGAASASRMYDRLTRRYGSKLAEVVSLAILGVIVALVVYSFSAIWEVIYVLEFALGSATISRWEAARQIVTLGIVATAYLTIRFVNRSIDTLAETRAITKHQSEVAHHVADVAIIAAAATVILSVQGINLTNIFLGAGAITAIVALTARETLAAMLAGFVLLFSRPFRVSDWIEVNDTSGIVTDVTIFTTKIQTFDDKHVLVPNDEVTSSQLTNYSRNEQLRLEVEVGIDYDTEVRHARGVIADTVSELDSIKSSPNPQVVTKELGESAIVLECHAWIGQPTMRRTHDARTDVIEAIVAALDREGISIPHPQRVHSTRDEQFTIAEPSEEASLSTTTD
jgi:small conductance mechanosensitive channel